MGNEISGDAGKRKAKYRMGKANAKGEVEKREDIAGGDSAGNGQGSVPDLAEAIQCLKGQQGNRKRCRVYFGVSLELNHLLSNLTHNRISVQRTKTITGLYT
jgi:hypothetical protein